MPVIRFVREGRDVDCYPGENLREVALREGIEIYGLKGKLGNCGGCGQCITCFVDVLDDNAGSSLSNRTPVEQQRLRRRPTTWRLACQALVQKSLLVLTRPQTRLPDGEALLADARSRPLSEGPTSWPRPEPDEADSGDSGESPASATSDEGSSDATESR